MHFILYASHLVLSTWPSPPPSPPLGLNIFLAFPFGGYLKSIWIYSEKCSSYSKYLPLHSLEEWFLNFFQPMALLINTKSFWIFFNVTNSKAESIPFSRILYCIFKSIGILFDLRYVVSSIKHNNRFNVFSFMFQVCSHCISSFPQCRGLKSLPFQSHLRYTKLPYELQIIKMCIFLQEYSASQKKKCVSKVNSLKSC